MSWPIYSDNTTSDYTLDPRQWVVLYRPRLRDFLFWTAVTILLIPLLPYGPVSEEIREERSDQRFSHSSGSVDTPSWKINDRWVYDGELDVYNFIASSGVSTNVNTLTGTLDVQVTDVLQIDVGGVQTIVYEATGQGDYSANNIWIENSWATGNIEVDMETVSLIRASDMAHYQSGGNNRYYIRKFLVFSCRVRYRLNNCC